jgi:hypothetical protein
MRISNIRLQKRKNTVRVSAQITFNREKAQVLYFQIPRRFESFLMTDASAFFAALLLPCMKRKESMRIEDSLSLKLATNANNIMKLVTGWNVGLAAIKIESNHTVKDTNEAPFSACFFSAGVDSFATFLKNKELVEMNSISPDEKITHFILVHGFDIELGNKALFTAAKKNIQKICEEEGITLITVETNLRSIIEPKLIWDFSHGGALAAVALLLRKQFNHVSIAGAVKRNEVFPYGTHPKLDPLWGTETLTIAHDGTEYTPFSNCKNVSSSMQSK